MPGFRWLRSLRPPAIHLGTAQRAVLRGHDDLVSDVCYSPDGTRLCSGSEDRTVRVWDASTGAELACLREHRGGVTSIAWSPDGLSLASGSRDHTVRIWQGCREISHFFVRPSSGGIEKVCWSPDGDWLAVMSGRSLTVHKVGTGEIRFSQRLKCGLMGSGGVTWSPDGNCLATWTRYNDIHVWNASDGTLRFRLQVQGEDEVTSVTWSPDSRYLVSGSQERGLQVWDARGGRELLLSGGIRGGCFARVGRRMVDISPPGVGTRQCASGTCAAVPNSFVSADTINQFNLLVGHPMAAI